MESHTGQGIEARARSGSRIAFSQLVSDHQAVVRAFLRRLMGDIDMADDLAQETFLTAWQRIEDLRPDVSFKSFVMGIAYRKAANARRSWMRRLFRDDHWSGLQARTTKPTHEDRLSLTSELAKLPVDQRAVLLLCLVDGLSHADAAEILQMPLGTVKSHVQRGRDHMMKRLTPETRP